MVVGELAIVGSDQHASARPAESTGPSASPRIQLSLYPISLPGDPAMGSFDVVVQTTGSLHPHGEPTDYLAEYTGVIRYTRDRD